MHKVIFNVLVDTGMYQDFTVSQVTDRAKTLAQLCETKDANQILWGLVNLEEYGDVTVNSLRQIAQNILAYTTELPEGTPVAEVPEVLDDPPVEPQDAPPPEVPEVLDDTPVEPQDAPPPGEPNGVQQNIG